MDNREIAALLEEMATFMELKGENPFRCRAFSNAARQIEMLQEPVADLVDREELENIRGIGKGLAQDITELVRSGRLKQFEDLKASVPEGLLEMTEIPGLGAKGVRTIYEKLGVSDVDALAKACQAGQVENLSGFGRKTTEKILQGIDFMQQHRGRFLCDTALAEAEALREHLQGQAGVIRLEVGLRRR